MRLYSTTEVHELFGISKDTIHVVACEHRKKHGENPRWYIKEGKNLKIDIDEFFKFREIERKAWLHATNELYWWLTYEPFNLTPSKIGKAMAGRSSKYTSEQGWRTFFSSGLFVLNDKMVSPRWTQTLDFLVHGTALMRFLIEEAKHGRYYDR